MNKTQKKIQLWLLICAFAIVGMIVIGGLTRLTGSGLSMVNWKPLTGWVPPFSEKSWSQEFQYYKTTPQFKKVNNGMDLLGFKKIFVLEFVHRIWGRLIGLLFALPFFYFLIRGFLSKKQIIKYSFFLFLGALQGFLGWYMVKSGLIDIPRVSPYRLTSHLLLALLCYSLIVYEYLSLSSPVSQKNKVNKLALCLIILVVGQIAFGGFVAGLEAGRVYNTFPLMNGQFIPDHLFLHSPFWLNFFENPIMVQFLHRSGAFCLIFFIIFFVKNFWQEKKVRIELISFVVVVLVQFLLGVGTLLMFKYGKPILLATIHQFLAIVLLTLSLQLYYKINKLKLYC